MSELKCPKCDRTFQKASGLGAHMRSVHGVAGTGKSTLQYRARAERERKEAKPSGALPGANHPSAKLAGEFPCPECDFVAKWKGGLTHHIKAAHMKGGKSAKHKLPFPCEMCGESFRNRNGLAKHVSGTHGVPAVEQNRSQLAESSSNAKVVLFAHNANGHLQQAEDDRNHRLEAAATYAAGRVAQLCESIALQHDLPAKSLTALVLRTVGATSQIR